MFRRFAPLALALILTLGTVTSALAGGLYPDVSDNDSRIVAIQWITSMGAMTGYTDKRFGVNDNVTRGEMAKILGVILGVQPQIGATCFNDMGSYDPTLRAYACKLAQMGLLKGYADGRFGPNDPISLTQMISLIVRAKVASGDWVAVTTDDPSIYPNVTTMSTRLEILTYLEHQIQVPKSPNVHGNLNGAYAPVTRGDAAWYLMLSFYKT